MLVFPWQIELCANDMKKEDSHCVRVSLSLPLSIYLSLPLSVSLSVSLPLAVVKFRRCEEALRLLSQQAVTQQPD